MKKTIIVVEDDQDLRRGISFALEQENYRVLINDQVGQTIEMIQREQPQLVILDINLPDGSGLDLCLQIREFSQVPIFFLTALDLETDIVRGITIGADDYITKPFSLAVLKAKVAAILKRYGTEEIKLISGPFQLDLAAHRLYKNQQEIYLSATEFRLLQYLMKNGDIVLEKEKLLNVLWDDQGKFVDENTLFVNIRRLRKKIETNSKQPTFIQTVHGVGYVWKRGC
ncbi:response regulator transcription factor [Enterococcus sp. AZ103]|uniref:response regulator transcription factor n=1 Tax=Enterococcus sp. AZ103 TaxID=2774628 RepID=UPI003F2618F2